MKTYEDELREITGRITPPEKEIYREAIKKWDGLAKPIGSLGLFEEMTAGMAALKGSVEFDIKKPALTLFCADNGVVAEGVSQTGHEVTLSVMKALAENESTASFMARDLLCSVIPVDMGVDLNSGELREEDEITELSELLLYDKELSDRSEKKYRILNRRILNGTGNILKGPAMTRQDCLKAVLFGAGLSKELKEEGFDLILTGEMGIGNTTTSAAVATVLTGEKAEFFVGRGSGLSSLGLETKLRVVNEAIKINKPDKEDPLDILSKVGGLDLAGLTGMYIGGAAEGVPVIIDGYISSVAALCAKRLCPECSKAMFASHQTGENGGGYLLKCLNKVPVINAGMHLGEGGGSLMLLPLLRIALNVYNSGHSFEKLGIEPYKKYEDA